MKERDKKLLASLIKEYDFEEFMSTVIKEMKRHVDDLSDLGLKEKSMNYHSKLTNIIKK